VAAHFRQARHAYFPNNPFFAEAKTVDVVALVKNQDFFLNES
jgi:hypothetical protein